jgi:hypothetical protein
VEELRQRRWIDAQGDFRASHFLDGFGFPDGRFRFAPDWVAERKHHAGLPALPDRFAATDTATKERPFRLIAAPARSFLNTTFTESVTRRKRCVSTLLPHVSRNECPPILAVLTVRGPEAAPLRPGLSLPRCSLRGRSDARRSRHARCAARGCGRLRSSRPRRGAP